MDNADYVVFPKVAFFEWMGEAALPPWPDKDGHHVLGGDVDCAPLAERIVRWVEENDLSNVVLGLQHNDGGEASAW